MITSKENPQVKLAVRLRESARERRAHGLFFLEGFRLCADALASGYEPEMLFMTEAAHAKYSRANTSFENAIMVSEHVAQKLADTQTPQGMFGIFRVQEQAIGINREAICSAASVEAAPQVVALENLQDPANLGAIARTAEALGLDGMAVSGGCDVCHPKALRASMGALLRLHVTQVDDLPGYLRACDLPSFAAVLDGTPLTECDFSGGAVVVIGNEGSGLSAEAIAACDYRLTIPMAGRAESLNAAAAAAIILWEMQDRGQGAGIRNQGS